MRLYCKKAVFSLPERHPSCPSSNCAKKDRLLSSVGLLAGVLLSTITIRQTLVHDLSILYGRLQSFVIIWAMKHKAPLTAIMSLLCNQMMSVVVVLNSLFTLLCLEIGSLRSTTPTSTKTSPQNITLHYRKFLAVWPSHSRLTMWP